MVGLKVTLEEEKETENLETELTKLVVDAEKDSLEIGDIREVGKETKVGNKEKDEEINTAAQQDTAGEDVSAEAEGGKLVLGEGVKEDCLEIGDTREVGKEVELGNKDKDEEAIIAAQLVTAGADISVEAEGKMLGEDVKEDNLESGETREVCKVSELGNKEKDEETDTGLQQITTGEKVSVEAEGKKLCGEDEIGDVREVGKASEVENKDKEERVNTETQLITAEEKVSVEAETEVQEDEDSETEDMIDYYNQPEILTDEERGMTEESEKVSMEREVDELFEEIETNKDDDESRKKNEERDIGSAV